MKEEYRIDRFVAYSDGEKFVIVEERGGKVRKPDINFKLDDSELDEYVANNTTRGIRKVGTIVETLENARLFIAREITLRARNESDRRKMKVTCQTVTQMEQARNLGKLPVGRPKGAKANSTNRALVTLPREFVDYLYTIKPDGMSIPAYIMFRLLPREEQSK